MYRVESIDNKPIVGSEYYFYDDGKLSPSRRYVATVTRIVTKEESKQIMFPTWCNEQTDWNPCTVTFDNEEPSGEISLFDKWIHERDEIDWVFAKDTDYFVECSIPKYDENKIWFAKTIHNGWFSICIQNGWQGGALDVNFEITMKAQQLDMKH